MKHYVLIASLIIFLACGGGKEAVVEETEPFSAYPSKPAPAQTQPRMVSPDSLALMFAQSQQPQTEPQPVVTAQDSVSTESVETTAEPAPVSAPDTVVAELSTELVEPEPEIESEEIPRRKIQIVEEESKPDVIYMQQIHRPDSSVPVRVTKPEIATETTTMTKAVRGMENLDFRDLLILDPIFFDANQAGTPSLTFNSNYIITLSKIVEALKRDLELNVRLFGYTDRVGDPQRNLQISEKRCVTIGKMICDMFDNAERDVISSRIELIPIGEADPLVEGNSPIRRVLNRRVAMVLTEEPIMGTTLLDYMRQGSQLKRPVAKPAIQITKDVSASGIESNYQSGMESYRNQQYDQARTIFGNIVSRDATHPLADNAQWWIGECYYHQKEYQSALQAYGQVFGKGNGNKEAYAQLRIGHVYRALNQKGRAIEELGEVSVKYPQAAEEIQKAQKTIAAIKSSYNQ